jgi:hypothetical protein
LQLLIFRQDAPLISPHPAHLAAEPYRASGLVLWREAVIRSKECILAFGLNLACMTTFSASSGSRRCSAFVVGQLMLRVELRYIIALGLVVFALGAWQLTRITRDYDFNELLLPQILRGIGMMCAKVPTTNVAMGTLPPDRVKNASGLFNLTRNLGGAVGPASSTRC